MKRNLLFTLIFLAHISIQAQVGINTTTIDNSAMLELKSSNKGLLLPKVKLLSKHDVTTIPNPATGLVVFNTANSASSVAESDRVHNNIIYNYNGSLWQTVMTDDTALSTINLPKIFAKGRKSATVNKTCNNSVTPANSGSVFNLTELQNLNSNGSITANKTGYYKFYIKVNLYFLPSSTRSPVIGYSKDGVGNSLTFRFRGSGSDRIQYSVSYSGVTYLEENNNSGFFTFALGGSNTCVSGDEIREQEVIWEYLGDLNS